MWCFHYPQSSNFLELSSESIYYTQWFWGGYFDRVDHRHDWEQTRRLRNLSFAWSLGWDLDRTSEDPFHLVHWSPFLTSWLVRQPPRRLGKPNKANTVALPSVDTDNFKGRASSLPTIQPFLRHIYMGHCRSVVSRPTTLHVVLPNVRRKLVSRPARWCLRILCRCPTWRHIFTSRLFLPKIMNYVAGKSRPGFRKRRQSASTTIW